MSSAPPLSPATNEAPGADSLYQTSSQHWIHSEQIRWTAIYNFLMGATLLCLAWATVFVAPALPVASRVLVLVVLAFSGVVLSALWIGLTLRSNCFVVYYAQLSRALEGPALAKGWATPFLGADAFRRTIRGPAKAARSARVLLAVPTVFLALFVCLLVASLI